MRQEHQLVSGRQVESTHTATREETAVLVTLLQTLLVAAGLTAAPEPGALALAAITVAAAALIVVALHAAAGPAASGRSVTHPRTAIDPSAPLLQSDPDAPGHPRPRAPQLAA
jgi:hypothetical protein